MSDDDETIDAEIMERPPAGVAPFGISDARDLPTVIDAEVEELPDDDGVTQLPARAGREAVTRIVPSGRECWWRLYSTPTSFLRDHQDHGVRAAHTFNGYPHTVLLDLGEDGNWAWFVLAYRINERAPTDNNALPSGDRSPALQGPDSIDILAEHRPFLPGRPRFWQQMTKHGQLEHPGENRGNWSWDDNIYADPPPNHRATGLNDDDFRTLFGDHGFHDLGVISKEEP